MTCLVDAIGRENVLPNCLCKEGYFDRDTIDCGQCTVPCETCINTRIYCITCVEDGENRKDPPDCSCKDGFYGENGTCLKCNYTCKNCDFLSNYCTECKGTGIGRTTNLPDCEC